MPATASAATGGWSVDLNVDNDVVVAADRDYTSGVRLAVGTPDLVGFATDPTLPSWMRAAQRVLAPLAPAPLEARNAVWSLSHLMFTPTDRGPRSAGRVDRPYAGWIELSAALSARDTDRLRSVAVGVGMVGPSTQAEQTQVVVHKITRQPQFHGWSRQLRDEPILQVSTDRRDRLWRSDSGPLRADLLAQHGGAVGNGTSYLGVGVVLRSGTALPDDFGTALVRSAGAMGTPLRRAPGGRSEAAGVHAFISIDGAWVLRDITLDGNSFSDGPRVDRRPLVATAAVGLTWRWRGGQVGYAHVLRSQQFGGQREGDGYGSLLLAMDL